MVDLVLGHNPFLLVVIVTPGVQVAGKPWEIAAGYLNPDAMSFLEVVAGSHRGEINLVDLSIFHKDFLVVTFAIPGPLNGLIQVVGTSVGIDIDKFYCKIGVFGIRGNVETGFDEAGDFHAFLQRF